MAVPIDPTSAAFLYAENRQMPMHVGGLQLFEKPEGAPARLRAAGLRADEPDDEIAPLFLKRPTRGHHHGRPVGVDPGRRLRPRVPLPAQRPAQARPCPRAARALLTPAQHPAGPGAAAVGGAPDRGPARRPGRALHEDAPLPRRRHLGDAAAPERDVDRPRRPRHAAAVGRASQHQERHDAAGRRDAASPAYPWRRCGRRSASPPTPPDCPRP